MSIESKEALKNTDNYYRTRQFVIRPSDPLYQYFDDLYLKAKNLYNAALFRVRQVMTGTQKDIDQRQPNEQEVLDEIARALPAMNAIRWKTYMKSVRKLLNQAMSGQGIKPDYVNLKLFDDPTEEKWYMNYHYLDALMKVTKNPDYRALPIHTAQEVLKNLDRNFKSYFESMKSWRVSSDAFTGKPKLPKYKKKGGRMTAVISNISGKITDKGPKHLKLPGTKLTYDLSSAKIPDDWKLMETRVIPDHGLYTLELVFRVPEPKAQLTEKPERIATIDLGMNNLAAITNNFGEAPMLVKGGIIKSRNQLYNKRRAHYQGILRQGKKPGEGATMSRRLHRMDRKRNAFLKDFFHKASRRIIDWCVEQNVDTLVDGINHNWKQKPRLGNEQNQHFVQIPFSMLVYMLRYKAEAEGIRFIETEESYTSAADILAKDFIPVYGQAEEKPSFSGKRICRGLYKTCSGRTLNANVNGSANILRKAVPDAQHTRGWDSGVLKASVPLIVV